MSSRKQNIFILAVPIINVVADSTQNYFQPGLASPGYLRAIILLAFLVFNFNQYYRKNIVSNIILFTLTYYFLLTLFSSNFLYTQSLYLKFLTASLMFPAGYYYLNSLNKFRSFMIVMAWTLSIYVAFILLANLFKLGDSDYVPDTIYFGAGRVNITKGIILVILMFPLIYKYLNRKTGRLIFFTISILALILVLLGIKRSAILGLIIGSTIYLLFTPNKTKLFRYILGVLLIIYLLTPFFYNDLVNRYQARQEEGRFDINQATDEEARVAELFNVLDAFSEGDIWYKLFGAELFNGRAYFKTNRILHTDYATILSGSGLIGFSLFLLIYYLMIKKSLLLFKKINNNEIRDILAVNLGLIFALIVLGIAGAVQEISLRGLVYLFCGSAFSVANNFYKEQLIQIKSSQV